MASRDPERDVDPSLAYLYARLAIVETRVREAVLRRRAVDPEPDDRFRGLYISDRRVDDLLSADRSAALGEPGGISDGAARDRAETIADAAEPAGVAVRLRGLAASFGLDAIDVEMLLVALAPDLDPRFESLYAYLQDDVSRRRASTGLALELSCVPAQAGVGRARLNQAAPLVAGGLLLIEEPERPFLTRSLRVPDRITGHLLNDDTPEPQVAALLMEPVATAFDDGGAARRSRDHGARFWYVRERQGTASLSLAVAALESIGPPPLAVDLSRLGATDDATEAAAAVIREARLRGGGLVAGPIDDLGERAPQAIRVLAESPCPVVLIGARGFDPRWTSEVPVVLQAPAPDPAERADIWRSAFDGGSHGAIDPALEMAPFRLTPEQLRRAARWARLQAAAQGRTLDGEHLRAGARAQNAAGLERLSRRIEPRVDWSDLVLPPDALRQLREMTVRARHRDRVLDDWKMGDRTSRGRGLTALFAGDSGTGKTMSAEVVAGDLGLDLYVIDLSSVVDKYIGETEKNLDRIFTEADRVNAVLLFDEADAIFGKRSEVRDARDRYANVEVAYLLQRMELFDGMAILTTNLRANLDEAFLRRLDIIADFPMPEEEDRLRLWQLHLGDVLPRAADVDLAFLARRFKISGGNIRNVTIAAAYYAAAEDRSVSMADLIRGTVREYQKLGRLTVEAEFGPYLGLVAAGHPVG